MMPEPSPLPCVGAGQHRHGGRQDLGGHLLHRAGRRRRLHATAALVLSRDSELAAEFDELDRDLRADEAAAEPGDEGDRGGGRHRDGGAASGPAVGGRCGGEGCTETPPAPGAPYAPKALVPGRAPDILAPRVDGASAPYPVAPYVGADHAPLGRGCHQLFWSDWGMRGTGPVWPVDVRAPAAGTAGRTSGGGGVVVGRGRGGVCGVIAGRRRVGMAGIGLIDGAGTRCWGGGRVVRRLRLLGRHELEVPGCVCGSPENR